MNAFTHRNRLVMFAKCKTIVLSMGQLYYIDLDGVHCIQVRAHTTCPITTTTTAKSNTLPAMHVRHSCCALVSGWTLGSEFPFCFLTSMPDHVIAPWGPLSALL